MNHYAKGFDTEPEEKKVSKIGLFIGAFAVGWMMLLAMWLLS